MSDDPHAQFDFWLGEWDLKWGKDGQGTNAIRRILEGQVIEEQFDGTPAIALRGMSVSVYDERAGKWKQTWVDNQGSYLDFSGGIADGKMVLIRDGIGEDGRPIKQRMVWYAISANELDWNWERSGDGGQTWEVAWQIHYRRRARRVDP